MFAFFQECVPFGIRVETKILKGQDTLRMFKECVQNPFLIQIVHSHLIDLIDLNE